MLWRRRIPGMRLPEGRVLGALYVLAFHVVGMSAFGLLGWLAHVVFTD